MPDTAAGGAAGITAIVFAYKKQSLFRIGQKPSNMV